jgi:hypothetical protein
MKKLFFAVFAVCAMFLTSCSSGKYLGHSENVNVNQTQVVLSHNNFKVVKEVSTVVIFEERYIFKREYLKQSAYGELVKEANLKGSQALINVTFEEVQRVKESLGRKPKTQSAILARGIVIEFTK